MKHLALTALAFATGLTTALATPAVAQDDFSAQLKARQGQFRIMALNLGILGGMAQGKMDYNAETAQAAADSLVAISGVYQMPMWVDGSDNMMIDGTRAQPTIWDEFDDFSSKWSDFGTAALVIQAAAGGGAEALGPAVGQVGGTCKACHEKHRAPAN